MNEKDNSLSLFLSSSTSVHQSFLVPNSFPSLIFIQKDIKYLTERYLMGPMVVVVVAMVESIPSPFQKTLSYHLESRGDKKKKEFVLVMTVEVELRDSFLFL